MRDADVMLAAELDAIANLSLPDLLEQWHALGFGEAPRLPLPLLQRLLAQLVQERVYGGLPASDMRKLDAAAREVMKCPSAASSAPTASLHRPPSPLRQVTLATGTRLVREWNGRTISVDVVGDGFVWNDVRYRSLSEIARTVTGTRWSGPRFFGIAGRG
ncbi:MAG: DUF2924 domain-containing protein [Sphingobium sp.]|nr:MAG: DUF2924 domain-containing protein [Sphingobium sp.]